MTSPEGPTVIPILTGPTGVGKTELSLDFAELLNGEIVNADSRQVFRGMTIGTAKPRPEESRGIDHHLVDILDIDQHNSAGLFMRSAEEAFTDILARGKTPIVVGGSTLYVSALTHGLADIPDIPGNFRSTLEHRAELEGYDTLYRELELIDPQSASRMDSTKSQRIIRALEVYKATGKTLSSFHQNPQVLPYSFSVYVLNRPRDLLYDRINCRVDEMLNSGLQEEVEALRDEGANDHLYPLRSPGYSEVISHLKNEIPRDEMIRLIKRNTRRYAKRQLTWFRRYPSTHWIDIESCTASGMVASMGAHIFNSRR